jgi:hypothetical protein
MADSQAFTTPSIKSQVGEDYDVQKQPDHFLNLYDLEYDPGTSVLDFYNQYRSLFVASLRQKGDTIKWQNNRILSEDEQLTTTFEDLLFANVLDLIDLRLPELVGEHNEHLIGKLKT